MVVVKSPEPSMLTTAASSKGELKKAEAKCAAVVLNELNLGTHHFNIYSWLHFGKPLVELLYVVLVG